MKIKPDESPYEFGTVHVGSKEFCEKLGLDLSGGWRISSVYVGIWGKVEIRLVRNK